VAPEDDEPAEVEAVQPLTIDTSPTTVANQQRTATCRTVTAVPHHAAAELPLQRLYRGGVRW
jgi:hypothetical protein